jgi:hypothetical protein
MLGGLLILGWIVLALLAGAMAVAEERRLGTLDSQYCLPVPCRIQFFVKFAVTLAVSALLAVALPWLLTRASSLLVDERLAELPGGELFCASLGAAALAFYASSLTRTVLQAVLTAFGLAVSGGAIAAWLDESGRGVLGGLGPLPGHGFVFLIVVPIAALVLLRLSFTNFRSPDGGWRLWWPNLRAWLLLALALYLSPLAVFLVRIGWALSTARGH